LISGRQRYRRQKRPGSQSSGSLARYPLCQLGQEKVALFKCSGCNSPSGICGRRFSFLNSFFFAFFTFHAANRITELRWLHIGEQLKSISFKSSRISLNDGRSSESFAQHTPISVLTFGTIHSGISGRDPAAVAFLRTFRRQRPSGMTGCSTNISYRISLKEKTSDFALQ
jgi:hypothetical protein